VEHVENTLGTKKIQKIQHPPLALPLFSPKEITTEPLGCMFAHLIGCLEISMPTSGLYHNTRAASTHVCQTIT